MRQMQWNTKNGNLDKHQILTQRLRSDSQALHPFQQDFGRLFEASPAAVFQAENGEEIAAFLQYASANQIPITIRGHGLSQGGQSLALDGGINLSMQAFNNLAQVQDAHIWAEVNASWADILEKTLPHKLAPAALPYNCNLSVGGLLSAGGMGAAAFREGPITGQVESLRVVDGMGNMRHINAEDSLFHACLGGQGRSAVMTAANIRLRPVPSMMHTDFMVYDDLGQWFEDIELAKASADYIELFCSPSVQGAALSDGQRKPFAAWLFGMHLSYGYEDKPPKTANFKPWKLLHQQEESAASYFLRHNPRFSFMQKAGQWDLTHPWYECFLSEKSLKETLPEILASLPVYFANLIHVVPIAEKRVGMTIFPEEGPFYELMILNPGIPQSLAADCQAIIQRLDDLLLPRGGKRYLSGYIGESLTEDYWRQHFGKDYAFWKEMKQLHDPEGIFTSKLFQLA